MSKKLAEIYHFDSFGKRDVKYDVLNTHGFNDIKWNKLELKEPYYFFVPKDFAAEEKYNKGFSVTKIFNINNTGFETAKDIFVVYDKLESLHKMTEDTKDLSNIEISDKYGITEKKLLEFKSDLKNAKKIRALYRPLDFKHTLISKNSSGVMFRPRYSLMKHFENSNIGIIIGRQSQVVGGNEWNIVNITNTFTDTNIFYRGRGSIFPLYLYSEQQDQLIADNLPHKKPNIDAEIVQEIEKKLGLSFVYDINDDYSECKEGAYFTPENLLDYIYAVLHSKSYRETYKEFLKIDFPKVPFDVNKKTFFEMAKLGCELRGWHLLENEKLIPQNFLTDYPEDGDNLVEKIKHQDEKVFINDTQYFDGVSKEVHEFYIGGYQPAQKWLKDRKGRALEYEDIIHYGKIILTLSETIRVMNEIEKVFEV